MYLIFHMYYLSVFPSSDIGSGGAIYPHNLYYRISFAIVNLILLL